MNSRIKLISPETRDSYISAADSLCAALQISEQFRSKARTVTVRYSEKYSSDRDRVIGSGSGAMVRVRSRT